MSGKQAPKILTPENTCTICHRYLGKQAQADGLNAHQRHFRTITQATRKPVPYAPPAGRGTVLL